MVPVGTHKSQVWAAERAGYIVIVSKTPERVRVIEPGDSKLQRLMLEAALEAVGAVGFDSIKSDFTKRLIGKVLAPPNPPKGSTSTEATDTSAP